MRFLKNRIAEAKAFQLQNQKKALSLEAADNLKLPKEPEVLPVTVQPPVTITNKKNTTKKKKRRPLGSCYVPETSRETKNLVKNYGKAICNFSTSSLALPYLMKIVKKEGVTLTSFLEFAEKSKSKIDGLHHFREILLSRENDDELTVAYRRIYKDISEVFIKFFSVNWIFHSKVKYKRAHLNFRFKMLRRIKSPELFTYLKGPKNTNAESS